MKEQRNLGFPENAQLCRDDDLIGEDEANQTNDDAH